MIERERTTQAQVAVPKPPLGLCPEKQYTESAHGKLKELLVRSNTARVHEITEAIQRYSAEAKPVPREWLNELRRRTK